MINGRTHSRIDIMLREECYLKAEKDVSKNKTCDIIRIDINDLLWNGFNYSKMI